MKCDVRTIAVTGANGFLGRNLSLRLNECGIEVVPITRESTAGDLQAAVACSDALIHLAGANRPIA